MKADLLWLKEGSILVLSFVLVLVLVTGAASAHAPLSVGSNDDIANATVISSPEKSFVIYSELHEGGEAQYYRFPMKKGQVLYGSLQVPGPDSMVPDIAVIGPGINSVGTVPSFIEVPAGSGAMVVPGNPPKKPSYEPFTPQPIFEVSRFNLTVPSDGDYYIAVHGSNGGNYGLAPGFEEEFTPAEWLFIPYSVINIHLWQGQSLAGIVAPLVIVFGIGLVLAFVYLDRAGRRREPVSWLLIGSGLLYIGGAAITAAQIIYTTMVTGYTPAVIITILFMAGPVILGALLVRKVMRTPESQLSRADGVKLLLIGLLGLLFWAGFILGPIIVLVIALFLIIRPYAQDKHE
jgi:hypothetical protein